MSVKVWRSVTPGDLGLESEKMALDGGTSPWKEVRMAVLSPFLSLECCLALLLLLSQVCPLLPIKRL